VRAIHGSVAYAVATGWLHGARTVLAVPTVAGTLAGLATHRMVLGINTMMVLVMVRHGFENFPPKKSGQRRHKLEALHAKWSKSEAHAPTLCFFATPYNLAAFLQEISEVFGPDLHVVLAREITKKFEEFQRGPVSLWAEHYSKHTPRGEFVLMFHPQNKR
jgi:16S rRNA C1402 (ribose-2'-O) methylase RsmI